VDKFFFPSCVQQRKLLAADQNQTFRFSFLDRKREYICAQFLRAKAATAFSTS